MSPFRVEWLQDAETELAAIWLRATDRQAVTAAQATIDRLLATDPLQNSTEVAEGLRKLIVGPLIVLFSVQQAKLLVEVYSVLRVPRT